VSDRFEHRVVEVERKDHDRWLIGPRSTKGRAVHGDPAEYLDEQAGDGWELVSVTPLHARSSLGGVQTDVVMYTLRRPVDR